MSLDLTTLTDAELAKLMLDASAEVSRRATAKTTTARLEAAVKGAEEGGLAEAEIDAVIQKLATSRRTAPTTPLPGSVAAPLRAKTV